MIASLLIVWLAVLVLLWVVRIPELDGPCPDCGHCGHHHDDDPGDCHQCTTCESTCESAARDH